MKSKRKVEEEATAYFKRVRQRSLGGEVIKGNEISFRGPPMRAPRNGRVIVHNWVAHTLTQIPGAHGFRAWTQLMDDKCVRCRCGWAGVAHFRYRGMPAFIYDGGPWGVIGNAKPKNLRRV